MPVQLQPRALPALGALHASGADALTYLQGQLSADLRTFTPGRLGWAGLHSPQGRVLALLALAPLAPPSGGAGAVTGAGASAGTADAPPAWVAVLPAALAETAAAALRRFVLRARVRIEVSPAGAVCLPGDAPGDLPPGAELPGGARTIQHPSGSTLWWLPAGGAAPADAGAQAAWERAELQLGFPTVLPQTSGSFVAQMLNLDCIGAIAFDKGCYTGQEVVARAHYRGRVKRRMQRFAAASLPRAPDGGELPPGSALRLADGRSAQLVRSAPQPEGGFEFLAVCAWPPGEATGTAAGDATGDTKDAPRVESRALPLPYPLPE